MRIWSIHPKYLDTKGLLALWRETLLAKHVLEGKTKGYKNHPQLQRFKKTQNPIDSINEYLFYVYEQANERSFNFNKEKINFNFTKSELTVTKGQVEYERLHLLNKLKSRDINKFNEFSKIKEFELHPVFRLTEGDVEYWEKI